jgi:hypothetical protein
MEWRVEEPEPSFLDSLGLSLSRFIANDLARATALCQGWHAFFDFVVGE